MLALQSTSHSTCNDNSVNRIIALENLLPHNIENEWERERESNDKGTDEK